MKRMMQRLLGMGVCAALVTAATATAQDLGTPVLSGGYDWDDGVGTILGSFGNITNPTNVGPEAGITPFSGDRMLRVTNENHVGTPQVYMAYIEHLEDGDVITASFRAWDDTPGENPRIRIWAHYAQSGDVNSFAGSAGGNFTYSAGTGWDLLEHTWEFDSDGGTRDALVIEARLFSTPTDCQECSTDYYLDDVFVEVFCAANEDLRISYPANTIFEGLGGEPGPDCKFTGPATCDEPDATDDFDWNDGESTVVGTFGNVSNPTNVTHPEPVHSGDHALRVTEEPHLDSTPQVHVAFIENLQHGDVINASVFGFSPDEGGGQMRIWANYGQSGDPASFAGSAGGNLTFIGSGGWEEASHTWEFDSDGGTRDALMIQVRLYASEPFCCECATDYYIDTLNVEVCSDSPAINIMLPQPQPDLGEPDLAGDYGWEDGEADIMDFFVPFGSCFGEPWAGENLLAENTGSPDPVNTGKRSLKLTEEPHCNSTPRATVAYIENLQDGDIIRAGFWAYDTTPGESPSMRIWGTYANSGDVTSFRGSAGGNDTFSNGCGWDELTHEWVFDAGDQDPPRTALKVDVRVFSTPSDCPECSTDFFVDDVWVEVWSENPNATITFPDGSVVGEPGPADCTADVIGNGSIGFFDQLEVINQWGTDDENADVNSDGIVDGADLGIVLGSYGPCEDFLTPAFAPVQIEVVEQTMIGSVTEYRLFVPFNDPDDQLVNIFNADVTSSTGFEPGSAVTIGLLPTPSDVKLDPNFDTKEFNNGTSLGEAAGWYNEQPVNNPVGRAGDYPDNKVLIGSFIIADGAEFSGTLSVTYRSADGRATYGTASFDVSPVDDCPADIDGSGEVDIDDLFMLLGAWGPCPGCPEDLDGNDVVDIDDLFILLGEWGPCP